MSVPSTPENGKRPGRSGFVAKLTGGKKDWNFNTFSLGSTVWSTLDADGSSSRPGTSASSSRPGTNHGSKGTGGSPYISKDSPAEEEMEHAKEHTAAPGKSKGKKVSADLSPYMSAASPYISKGGGTIHSRPMSRMGPVAAATSLMRRSLTLGSSGSSRPATPVQAARPKTQASSDQARSGQLSGRAQKEPGGSHQADARPSTQPASKRGPLQHQPSKNPPATAASVGAGAGAQAAAQSFKPGSRPTSSSLQTTAPGATGAEGRDTFPARPGTQESLRSPKAARDSPRPASTKASPAVGSSMGSHAAPGDTNKRGERAAVAASRPSSQQGGRGPGGPPGAQASKTSAVARNQQPPQQGGVVRPGSSSSKAKPKGAAADAVKPAKPQTPAGAGAGAGTAPGLGQTAPGDDQGLHVGRAPSAKAKGSKAPSSRPASRGQSTTRASKASADPDLLSSRASTSGGGGGAGADAPDTLQGLHVGRPSSSKAKAAQARPGSRGNPGQEPREPSRSTSRPAMLENEPAMSRSGKAKVGASGGGAEASGLHGPSEGHRAVAQFAISGLGMDNRPTTQERHAAQREQLGFGKRPTTQERQQLTTRAGPRSPKRRDAGPSDHKQSRIGQSFDRPQSRAGFGDKPPSRAGSSDTNVHSKLSHGVEGSRPSSVSGPKAADGLLQRTARAVPGGSRHRTGQAVPTIAENIDGEAYGMTLSDYITQMAMVNPLDRPLSGASGTMAVEDCIPPDDASLLSDYSDCSYVDPEDGFSDRDYMDPDYASSSSEFSDPGMMEASIWDQSSTDRFFSAAENCLDLRPATAAVGGLMEQRHTISTDAADTRQVDLASLPAALFHPRTQETRPPRPPGSGKSGNIWHRAGGSGRKSSGRRGQGGALSPTSRAASGSRPKAVRKALSARPGTSSAEAAEHFGDAEGEYEEDSEEDGGDWDDAEFNVRRPPSRQRPPPEALHLFNALGKNSGGGALKPSGFSMGRGVPGSHNAGHSRPKTTATQSRPLSGPQLRLKSDGSGFANATQREVEAATKLHRPPSRGRGPSQLSAGIRHNAAEDFPEPPPKGQGAYDLDIMGFDSDSEWDA